jgi:hypothetical protein
MVMRDAHSAFSNLVSITAVFHDNQQARASYLGKKICNII